MRVPSFLELTDLTVLRQCLPFLCDGHEVMLDICRSMLDIQLLTYTFFYRLAEFISAGRSLSVFDGALYLDVTEVPTNFVACQRMHFTL